MNTTPINMLVAQAIIKLQEAGLKQATIHFYKEESFKQVLQFYKQHGATTYSSKIMDDYHSFIIRRLKRGEIGKKHFNALEIGANRLTEFVVYGEISAQPKKRGSNIRISVEYDRLLTSYILSLHQSESTVSSKVALIRRYFSFLENNGKNSIAEVQPEAVQQFYFETMKYYGSKRRLLSVLRDFHRFAHEQNLIEFDYANALCAPAVPHKKVMPCFSPEELERLFSSIGTETSDGKRDYAILTLALNTGLRAIDIAHLRLSDIDWKRGEISIIQQKTRQPLVLPLNRKIFDALDDYIQNGRPVSSQEYVFLRSNAPYQRFHDGHAIGSMFRRRIKKAGLPKENGDGRSVHALRRTIGTRMAEAGVPLTTISQVLGHRSVNSVKRYLSLDYTHLKKCALSLSGIEVSRKELM